MIKKSIIQGLFAWIMFYIALIALNMLELSFFDNAIFSVQGMVLSYIFIAFGTIAFMRL